ncbi:MAG TPA: hypothetical protein PKA13_16130 [Geminicoccaceae bacterium]|nr:hypothetical protein [Geminicoccus sp.]HMU51304.1 hypothetical protein [Geminicoccaceae bacterium]
MGPALRTPSFNRALATARTSTKALVRAGEIAVASGEVIDARSRLIAEGLGNPAKLVDPELVGMVTEKIAAAMASWGALAVSAPGFAAVAQSWLAAQARILGEGGLALAGAHTPQGWLSAWQSCAARSIDASTRAAEQLMASASRTVASTIAPIHSKATGNARRLRRAA